MRSTNQKKVQRGSKKSRYSNKLGVLGIIVVVAVMGILLFSLISKKEDELAKLSKTEDVLQQQYDLEVSRAQQLEEKRIYVKTKKYVEEVAKQLGLVYPNEVIYKPQD